jgi:hypothetical protein
MTDPAVLGAISSIHELMSRLSETVPPNEATRQFHPELGSLAWYLGHSVYLETFWLREFVAAEDCLTRRVEHMFGTGDLPLSERC